VKIVAVTGKIGSGKSTVCRIMCEFGAVHVDADQLAREVLRPGTQAFQEVVETFGEGVLASSGEIDRASLAERVFQDEESLAHLDRITHPEIGRKIAARLKALSAEGAPAALVEAALLGRGEIRFWDALVVVQAPEEVRLDRLLDAGMSKEDALRRIEAQDARLARFPEPYHEIDNGDGLDWTRRQVKSLWQELGDDDIVESENRIQRGCDLD